tara:strand:+ start:3263 stop:3811 length:549 start_codon:yes stop_codon:yes gene_type:complete
MEESGSLHSLPTRLARRILRAEHDCLDSTYRLKKCWTNEVAPALRTVLESLVSTPAKGMSGRSQFPVSLVTFLSSEAIENIGEKLIADNRLGVAIELLAEGNRTEQWYLFSEKTLAKQTTAYVWQATCDVVAEQTAFLSQKSQLESALEEVKQLRLLLKRRIHEPQPFWETLSDTVADVFGR